EPRYRFVNRTPDTMKVLVLQFSDKPDKALTEILGSANPHEPAKAYKTAFAGTLDERGNLAISSTSVVGPVELISRYAQLNKNALDVRLTTDTAWEVVLGRHHWYGFPNPLSQTA